MMPHHDCGRPDCGPCQTAFSPDRSEAIRQYEARRQIMDAPTLRQRVAAGLAYNASIWATRQELAAELRKMADDEIPAIHAEILRLAAEKLDTPERDFVAEMAKIWERA